MEVADLSDNKYRVHEVAKDFKINGKAVGSKKVMEILTKYAETPSSHMAVLSDKELSIIFDYLTQNNQIKDLEEVFKETYHEPKSGKGEEAAYKAALQPAMSGRAADSIGRFQTFLQEYPQGRFAANAEYWIGEGYYAQGKYKDALAQFEKVNSQWPRHHKNADALLKTGMTLSRMGDKEGAAQAYKKLLSQFPNSEAAGLARSRGLGR